MEKNHYDSDEDFFQAEEDRSDDELLEAETATLRQHAFQMRRNEQTGGGRTSQQPRGRFHFDLAPVRVRRSGRFGVEERVFHTRLRQTGQFVPMQNLNAALRDGMQRSVVKLIDDQEIPDADRIYVNLASHRMNNNYDYRGFTAGEWRRNGDRVQAFFNHLTRILNSNQQFEMDDSFHLSFVHVARPPHGTGGKRKFTPGHKGFKYLKQHRYSVVNIPQDSQICCAKAIVTAKAFIDNHPKIQSFKRGCRIQTDQATLLMMEAGVAPGPCGYAELTKFAKAPSMQGYQLILVDADRAFDVRSFSDRSDKQIVLLYQKEHYDTIKSLKTFLNKSYLCAHCLKGYNDLGQHACIVNKQHCNACLQNGCPDYLQCQRNKIPPTQQCPHCHRNFYGATCMMTHRIKGQNGKPVTDGTTKSVCTTRRLCSSCLILLRTSKEQKRHKCGYFDCPSCKLYVEVQTHQCFLQVEAVETANESEETANESDEDGEGDSKKEKLPPVHVFFDIEATQEREMHLANLLIAETDEDDEQRVFEGESCVKEFLDFLEELTEDDERDVIVLAHNFQGYDGYFVVDEYHKQCQILQQIRNGAKLLQVTTGRIRFIDSLSFLTMPLAAFPKTFGLTELKKGYFPHKFNVPTNQEYVGPIPAKDYYMPESMSPDARKKFETWHDKQRDDNVVFDFQKELVAYCRSDVRLLKEGCLVFKRLFEHHAHFNPFEQMTIASACNRDLRKNRMEPNTIASEPLHGWRRNTNHSRSSMEWLYFVEETLQTELKASLSDSERNQLDFMDSHYAPVRQPILRHARSTDGEFKIPESRYSVDGYNASTNTVYEFHGCYWHGCPKCYPQRTETHQRLLGVNMEGVYRQTQRKMTFLRSKGYRVVEMWECDWTRLKNEDPHVREYMAGRCPVPDPLNPRDAFFGGRTNAIKLYHRAEGSEKIKYYDFTSLYPWVNKTQQYPVGHPVFIHNVPPEELSHYFGIAQCSVLPPKDLYHPVLPYRYAEKLTFPLCAACVRDQMSLNLMEKVPSCSHDDKDRILHGTWCTPELLEAVAMGYEILTINELWHFPKTQTGLFKDYVNTWLKIKEEASWNEADEDKQAHIDAYFQHEGIRLEADKMAYNSGLRSLAKIMLNSMWGKFGQQTNKTQVVEFTDPIKFHAFHDSDKVDIRYVSPLTEDRVEVHYKLQEADVPVSPNLNIFVACFTTCWARLRLYGALKLLGERCLYFDTDSVVFMSTPDSPDPPLGKYLGDFKDELDNGDSIVEFVSGGPKNYGYKTKDGHVCCKVRGFNLNSEANLYLNYDVMRQNVLDEVQRPLRSPRQTVVPKSYQIERDAKNYKLYTFPLFKRYQLVCVKRILDPITFKTYPYGYENFDPEDMDNVNMLCDF